MMIINGRCPHCGEKSGFNIFAFSEYTCDILPDAIAKSQINEPTFSHPSKIVHAHFFAAGTCGHCGGPVLLDLKVDSDYLFALRAHISNREQRYNGPTPEIIAMWPEPIPPYSHPALPEKVRELFTDIQQGLKYNMSAPWIISGCRSVLEEAVKVLGGEGKNLVSRIESLREKAVVNGVLAEWAHHVRIEGNEAIHELEGTRAEATELVEFTRLFLQYSFEFPSRVKEARKQVTQVNPVSL